jgi:hypothetical protein
MKRIAVLAGAVILSFVLSGCGSTSYSYYLGYHAGQNLAANAPRWALVASKAPGACRRDWVIAGSVGLGRSSWLRGCTQAFDVIAKTVGRP